MAFSFRLDKYTLNCSLVAFASIGPEECMESGFHGKFGRQRDPSSLFHQLQLYTISEKFHISIGVENWENGSLWWPLSPPNPLLFTPPLCSLFRRCCFWEIEQKMKNWKRARAALSGQLPHRPRSLSQISWFTLLHSPLSGRERAGGRWISFSMSFEGFDTDSAFRSRFSISGNTWNQTVLFEGQPELKNRICCLSSLQ